MPVPIQPVTSFAEAELWYMYQQLTEINTNTAGGGGGGGLSQTQLYEVFNGTNTQGFAVSLFESLSGNNNSLANLLIEDKSGSFETAANLLYFILQYLSPNSLNGSTIANQLSETLSGGDQILANLLVETNSGSFFSAANLLDSIKLNTSNTATNTGAINTNTANTTTAINTTNSYLSVLRTPVILSTSGISAGINAQLHNIAFANIGAAVGTITVNGVSVSLPVGAVVEYNAGGLNNRFAVNSFGYNGTGTTLLIQYVQ
jgi:hypothetical protein